MSGEKRSPIEILRDDLNYTRNQVTNIGALNSNLQNSLKDAQRQRVQDNNKFSQVLKNREQSFKQSVSGLKSNMRGMETRHASAMQQQNNRFNSQLRQQDLGFSKRLLKEQDERVKAMKQQRRQLEIKIYDEVGKEKTARIQAMQRQKRELESTIHREVGKEREDRIDAMRRQKKELENRILHEVGKERAERIKQVNRLDNKIDNLEVELKNDIIRVENEFNKKINIEKIERQRAITNLRDWTAGNLQQQREEYLTIAQQQQNEINNIKQDVQRIFDREHMNRETASAFIDDLKRQIKEAETQLPHEKFAPGEIARLKDRIAIAESNLNSMEQAAIAGAQAVYVNLVTLRQKIINKEQEFAIYHSTALEAARGLFENIRKNRKVELEEGAEEVEVNYWTNGKFHELEKEIESLVDKLVSDKANLSLESIKQTLAELEEKNAEQDKLIEEAIERVISSQLRAEMGDVVVDALEQEGFSLVESGYEKEDQRKIYLVKIKNIAGTEIVAAIIPDDATNTNTLSINTRDSRILNEAATVERMEEINRILGESGMHVGKTECRNDHIEGLYDVENIIKKEGQGVPKRVLEKARLLNSQTS